ncbi:hypothetical protein [Flavivirga algicola]|uniref:Uncharacterized protein n=1 Tax=Flavivirga algicola TaxID=2729136 RepID=A0ABX1RUW8_9FLAO|nr:hypothetical protein [Flavivirga algicola]NMH87341.1 hypothetical protein [Flavivirga algicola]
MKKLGYILIFAMLSSCMKNKEFNKEIAPFVLTEDVDDSYLIENSHFNITTLARQKLQEYYDLSLLQKYHPEFENDIKIQLSKLSDTVPNIPNTSREIVIKNVSEIDNQKLTDSTSKLQLRYEVISEQGSTFDTISAILKTKTVILNNNRVTTNKLTFKRY